MNRFEKKCLIASSGFHGFLLLLLVFGSAFFVSKDKPVAPLRINTIPTDVLDNVLASGGGNPNLPRTDNRQKGETILPQPEVAPAPATPPKPKATPPEPKPPKPEVHKVEEKKMDPPTPKPPKVPEVVKLKPVEKTPEPKTRIDLNELQPIARTQKDKQKEQKEIEARERAREIARQQRIADQQRQQIADRIGIATDAMRRGFKGGTEVEVGGPGSVAYADYGAFVKALYEDAWQVVQDLDDEEAMAAVRVTIARDGRVLSARIIQRSKNASLNRSVQRALDSIKHIGRPFPDSSKDSERSFDIKFNLKSKQLLG